MRSQNYERRLRQLPTWRHSQGIQLCCAMHVLARRVQPQRTAADSLLPPRDLLLVRNDRATEVDADDADYADYAVLQ